MYVHADHVMTLCTVCVCVCVQLLLKKDEMIRHFKWHRKRDESLQHGFMRYSQLDDCSRRHSAVPPCAHNLRQTHYHCIQVSRHVTSQRRAAVRAQPAPDTLPLHTGEPS